MIRVLHVNRYGTILGGKEITIARTMEATADQCEHHLAYHLPELDRPFPCELHRIKNPSRVLQFENAFSTLDMLLTELKPDLIHLHDHVLNPPLLNRIARNYPLVRTLHDASVYCPIEIYTRPGASRECSEALGPACFKKCLRWFSLRDLLRYRRFQAAQRILNERALFTASGDFLRELLLRHGVPHDRITLIPCWMPRFEISPGEENLVGAVMRLHRDKGLEDLLALLEEIPELRILVAGDGPHRAAFEDMLRRRNLRDRVEMTGWILGEELEKVYRRVKLLVLPTHTCEGLPLSLQEGAANGKPLVGYNLGGVRDVIKDQRNGILVPRGNTAELVKAVRLILERPALQRSMAEASVGIARKRYRREDHRELYLRTYNRASYFFKTGKI